MQGETLLLSQFGKCRSENEHLPIYKYDLTIYFEKIVRNFTRYYKYTLGNELGKRAGSCRVDFSWAILLSKKLPAEEKTG
jgi:hypothetical protein